MLDHSKNPLSFDNCSSWDDTKLHGSLRKHHLDPYPLPSRKVLVLLVEKMRKFVSTIMNVIETMLDEDEAVAMGTKSMGKDLTIDQELILERIYAPADRNHAMVQPQIPIQFRLDSLETLIPARIPEFEQSFKALRLEWCFWQKLPQD